jgi:hypothetical protein
MKFNPFHGVKMVPGKSKKAAVGRLSRQEYVLVHRRQKRL